MNGALGVERMRDAGELGQERLQAGHGGQQSGQSGAGGALRAGVARVERFGRRRRRLQAAFEAVEVGVLFQVQRLGGWFGGAFHARNDGAGGVGDGSPWVRSAHSRRQELIDGAQG